MKKILSLIVITLICMANFAYAASSCNISLSTQKSEYSKDENVVVFVNMSDIQSEQGIIAFGATLQYDKSSLEYQNMESQNGWTTPYFNEANGKFVMDRNGPTTSNETILKITFKVTESENKNVTISLNGATASDGTAAIKVGNVQKNITIKNNTSTPTPDDEGSVTPTPNDEGSVTPTPSDEGNINPTPDNEENETPTPNNGGNATPTPNVSKVTPTPSSSNTTPTPTVTATPTPTSTAIENKTSPTPSGTIKPTPTPENGDSSVSNVKIPNTGTYSVIIIIFVVVLAILIVLLFIKIKTMNK